MEVIPHSVRAVLRSSIELIVIGIMIAAAYVYYPHQVRTVWSEAYQRIAPCHAPITYRIGSVDPKFGLSQPELQKLLDDAAGQWNTAAGKTVLAPDQKNGVIVVDFVYDYRQKATATLQNLGVSLSSDKDAYQTHSLQYDNLRSDYLAKKSSLDAAVASFQAHQSDYNDAVQSWNARGGAPKSVYAQLQQEKADLQTQQKSLQSQEDAINAEVDDINALANQLNSLGDSLNEKVQTYNTVGASTGGEFEEGLYQSRFGSQSIDIYEFNSLVQLKRVLAHELGHAIGLEHVDDPDAIMYKLNESQNTHLTKADIAELFSVCKL